MCKFREESREVGGCEMMGCTWDVVGVEVELFTLGRLKIDGWAIRCGAERGARGAGGTGRESVVPFMILPTSPFASTIICLSRLLSGPSPSPHPLWSRSVSSPFPAPHCCTIISRLRWFEALGKA